MEQFYEEFAEEHTDEELYWKENPQPGGYLMPLRAKTLLKKIEASIQSPNDSIVDFGCGDGILLKKITKPCKKFGVDICDTHIQRAQNNIPNGTFKKIAPESQTPFKTNLFDVTVSSEVIEHVKNPKQFIQELVRITKPGGTIIVTTPSKFGFRPGSLTWKWNIMVCVNRFFDWVPYKLKTLIKGKSISEGVAKEFTNHHHLHIFSARNLRNFFPKKTVTKSQLSTCGLYLPPMKIWSRLTYHIPLIKKLYTLMDIMIGKIPFLKQINCTLILVVKKK